MIFFSCILIKKDSKNLVEKAFKSYRIHILKYMKLIEKVPILLADTWGWKIIGFCLGIHGNEMFVDFCNEAYENFVGFCL